MIEAAVTSYNFSLFLHVTAVVVGLGATFAEAVMFPVAMKAGTKHLPYVHRLQLAINQWMAVPALLIVLLTGFYQVSDADWDLGEFWLSASFAIVFVIGGLTLAYFIPTDRKLIPLIDRDIAEQGEPSAEYQRQARTEGRVGALLGLLLIAAIFLMITKPGA